MSQVVEVPGLTSQAEAEQRAEDFRIDNVPVEIIPQANGTFTVRATYPDDVHIPGAVLNQAPLPPTPHVPPPPPAAPTSGAKTLGNRGAALVKAFESCMRAVPQGFQAYLDPVQVLTIGWGHTNDNGRNFNASAIWTQAECDAEFVSDMAIFVAAANNLINVPVNQDQFDALVSFAFNVGANNLRNSTLLKKLNAGDFAGAAQEFQRWNKAAGRVLTGLTRRRACEALLFQSIPDKNYDGIPD
jgi:GH24 family phage-related lysozyme (muramidase)